MFSERLFVQTLLFLSQLLIFKRRSNSNTDSSKSCNRSSEDKNASNHSTADNCSCCCKPRSDARSRQANYTKTIKSGKGTDTTYPGTKCSRQNLRNCAFSYSTIFIV